MADRMNVKHTEDDSDNDISRLPMISLVNSANINDTTDIVVNNNNNNNNNNVNDNNDRRTVMAYLEKDLINNRLPTIDSKNVDRRNNYRSRRAPIVGWHNGSPTVFPSSPCKTPELDLYNRIDFDGPISEISSSKSSGICQDSGNTEDLSSLADERLFESTPARTIDRSIESLSPDKDTLLTMSPDNFGRNRVLSLGDESGDKFDFLSPDTDGTEDNRMFSTTPIERISMIEPRNSPIKINPRKEDTMLPIIIANPGYQGDVKDISDFDSAVDLENDLDSTIEDKEMNKKPRIPDGGWGWVVVLASLVISMIADGVSFSFGLLYIEFLKEFGASKAKTAWIGSLFMAVPLLSGPVMSALVDRYGCRKMTIAGGLISGIGFVLSFFSNTIEVMYLTFGVIAGLGLGLCYVTAVVSIAYWFDKKRTLAVGLGACGTGIGTFVYAPMTTFFIEEYGWRGTCLMLAGTFFNMIVCGAVMRDPEWWILEQKKQQQLLSPKKSNTIKSELDGNSSHAFSDEFPGVEELRQMLKTGKTEYLLQSLGTSTATPNRAATRGSTFRSVVNLPTFVKECEKVPLEVLESLSANSRLYNVILENYPNLLKCRSLSDKLTDDSSVIDDYKKTGVTMTMRVKMADEKTNLHQIQDTNEKINGEKKILQEIDEASHFIKKDIVIPMTDTEKVKSRHHIPGLTDGVVRTDSLPWLRRQFSTNTHYFKDIRVHRNSVMYRGAALNLQKYRLRASSCPNIYRNSMTTLAKESEEKWYSELVNLLKGMMDFSMFLEFHFLLMSLSTILLFTWFIVPYFYLAEHLTRNGYSESDGANLLSIIGITNTIGMIGLGWAGDQPWMNVSKTYACCLAICGVSTMLMSTFTLHYIPLIITSASFGLFFASSFSFTPVILVELIPLERFTTAYGLTLLCQGIGNLLGPPLAGWLFDITNSWEMSFMMAGLWIIVAGLLIGIIPFTKNRKIWGSGLIEMERLTLTQNQA